MAEQRFKTGCIELAVKNIGGRDFDLLNIDSFVISAVKEVNADDGVPTKATITIEVVIDGAIFHKHDKTFAADEWKAMTDRKVVWSFEAVNSDLLRNTGEFKIMNFDGQQDNIVGNETSFNFLDAKIGGAG